MRKRSNVINSLSTIRSRQNSNLFRLRDVHLTKIARAKLHIELESTFMYGTSVDESVMVFGSCTY